MLLGRCLLEITSMGHVLISLKEYVIYSRTTYEPFAAQNFDVRVTIAGREHHMPHFHALLKHFSWTNNTIAHAWPAAFEQNSGSRALATRLMLYIP
jgi:hypothetical protein